MSSSIAEPTDRVWLLCHLAALHLASLLSWLHQAKQCASELPCKMVWSEWFFGITHHLTRNALAACPKMLLVLAQCTQSLFHPFLSKQARQYCHLSRYHASSISFPGSTDRSPTQISDQAVSSGTRLYFLDFSGPGLWQTCPISVVRGHRNPS